LAAEPAEQALSAEEAEALRGRIERLLRRREQLGPVNPLAKAEYDEAVTYVEDLERQRTDLETALRELKALIRDTDRQIRETFEGTSVFSSRRDRKSTRLNSSHDQISYAVFCLKKKNGRADQYLTTPLMVDAWL